MAELTPGSTKALNALWGENPLNVQFASTNRVVVAQIQGPAEITMMHFALPALRTLNRDLLLRIYWDGESSPSVDCPLVDFFCDPDGTRSIVNTALLNVRRGFNCYFPMPFRKSAKVELLYDGQVKPGRRLWRMMPCYSYVCYRTLTNVPPDTGYFCASWRQETVKLGLRDYVALEARGRGKFVGWNVTVRWPGRKTYPVDENEKFYIDGETNASVEFQGLEDSFGFSWGFPETENMFPLTGWFPFLNGAAAYRFFLQDSISFDKSLTVAIGFGQHEGPSWRRNFSKFGSSLQFSSTVYWYQIEPHAPLPPMPSPAERAPAPDRLLFWPEKLEMPSAAALKAKGVKLLLFCGFPGGAMIHHEPGYSISWIGESEKWSGWTSEVFYCRQNAKEFGLELKLPKGAKGMLRLYIIDPDNYMGGRKETLVVGGQTVGTFENFQDGRWIEVPVGPKETADGKLNIRVINARQGANAVLSKVEWLEK
ncbi:MAG: DUF2961 domain-containing protein [Verrucomicrobiota bacterium]|nr:DUF2961 domain-containing protein [Verrucomicrobiota bacterium]